MGLFYSVVLVISSSSLIVSCGFISFFWFADDSNTTWKLLASEDWITKALAVSSLFLRTSISLQASIATAMLASLALESSQVLLSHLASVSTMRNSNSGPYNLAWLFISPVSFRSRGWERSATHHSHRYIGLGYFLEPAHFDCVTVSCEFRLSVRVCALSSSSFYIFSYADELPGFPNYHLSRQVYSTASHGSSSLHLQMQSGCGDLRYLPLLQRRFIHHHPALDSKTPAVN